MCGSLSVNSYFHLKSGGLFFTQVRFCRNMPWVDNVKICKGTVSLFQRKFIVYFTVNFFITLSTFFMVIGSVIFVNLLLIGFYNNIFFVVLSRSHWLGVREEGPGDIDSFSNPLFILTKDICRHRQHFYIGHVCDYFDAGEFSYQKLTNNNNFFLWGIHLCLRSVVVLAMLSLILD